MSRLVVADAGPLIHLEQVDALSLLELTGKVLVPKTVLDELEDGPTSLNSISPSNRSISTRIPYIHISIRERPLQSWSVPTGKQSY